MPRTTPKNVEYLREHGPTPFAELPAAEFSLSDRRHGAARLTVEGGRLTNPDSVAYLFEEHDPAAVVETFIDANPGFIESVPRPALIQYLGEYGQEFKAAAKELLDPYDWSEHWSAPEGAAGLEEARPGIRERILRWVGSGGDR